MKKRDLTSLPLLRVSWFFPGHKSMLLVPVLLLAGGADCPGSSSGGGLIGGPGCQDDDLSCDGVDDDCDGQTDEDFVPDDSCGLGYCQETNRPSLCDRGRLSACQPNAPLALTDLTCDGVDDDCDGQTDEEYSGSVTCGEGECRRPAACADGELVCEPGLPAEEVCDGLDNNCDDRTDEGTVCGECRGVPYGTVISTGEWGDCGRFERECDEVGLQSRILVICKAGEPVPTAEEQTCRRETETLACPGGSCANGTCRAALCPDENDRFDDAIPIRVVRSSKVSGALCRADNNDDRYRITLEPGARVQVRLSLRDRPGTGSLRLWLYPTVDYAEPALQGGEDGLIALVQQNTGNAQVHYYLLVFDTSWAADTTYLLEFLFERDEPG